MLKLYKDFSYETVIVEPEPEGLLEQSRKVLLRYFDDKLTGLIVGDHECVERTQETCALDFMPLWDSQDVGASDLAIKAAADPSVVEVTFSYRGSEDKTKLIYQLTQTSDGWRISDIHGSDWSLLSILERDQKQP
ncbi:MAG: hypothetical protein U1F34_01320 [Gammaproteobacteria bacterium]